MKKVQLINLLQQYSSGYIEELNYKTRMLEVLNICDDCFERGCRVGHFTASSWLLDHQLRRVLLMHHVKLDRWLQLGGHCDGNYNVLSVAIKEAQEESGIKNITALSDKIFDIDIHLTPQIKDDAPHYHFDIRFLLKVVETSQIVRNHEANALQWFDLHNDKLPVTDDSMQRMLVKSRKFLEEVK